MPKEHRSLVYLDCSPLLTGFLKPYIIFLKKPVVEVVQADVVVVVVVGEVVEEGVEEVAVGVGLSF